MKRKAITSKFIRVYGMTLEQLAAKLGVSPYKAYTLHLQKKIRLSGREKRCPNCYEVLAK